jgi:hypothetical protein
VLIVKLRHWKAALTLSADFTDLAVVCLFKLGFELFLSASWRIVINIIITVTPCLVHDLGLLSDASNPAGFAKGHDIHTV